MNFYDSSLVNRGKQIMTNMTGAKHRLRIKRSHQKSAGALQARSLLKRMDSKGNVAPPARKTANKRAQGG